VNSDKAGDKTHFLGGPTCFCCGCTDTPTFLWVERVGIGYPDPIFTEDHRFFFVPTFGAIGPLARSTEKRVWVVWTLVATHRIWWWRLGVHLNPAIHHGVDWLSGVGRILGLYRTPAPASEQDHTSHYEFFLHGVTFKEGLYCPSGLWLMQVCIQISL
jgi:hypothetical protein